MKKVAQFVDIYDPNFSIISGHIAIKDQLEIFIHPVIMLGEFMILVVALDLVSLAMKMVETKRYTIFPLVYHLIELAMRLPLATP